MINRTVFLINKYLHLITIGGVQGVIVDNFCFNWVKVYLALCVH